MNNQIPCDSTQIVYTLDDVKYIQEALQLHKGDVVKAFECLEVIKESDAFNDGKATMWLRKISDIKNKMHSGIVSPESYMKVIEQEFSRTL